MNILESSKYYVKTLTQKISGTIFLQ